MKQIGLGWISAQNRYDFHFGHKAEVLVSAATYWSPPPMPVSHHVVLPLLSSLSYRSNRITSALGGLTMTTNMDLSVFKMDIDELLADYAKEKYTAFADFKSVWMKKKFSYIYEGRPKTNSGVFMQSLFLHCIGHMASTSSLPLRLGALYCLYCLYECQPYKPCFKIYLSLEEFKKLKDIVIQAKQNGVGVVPALVKRMLDKDMFLFGFVNLLGDSGTKRVDELTTFHNKQARLACAKLFANTQIESYMHKDLGVELELENIKRLSTEYAKAKELAIAEARQTVDVEDAKHILQNGKLLGDRVEEIVKEWDAQKEEFYEKTGVSHCKKLDESGVSRHNEVALADDDNDFDEITQLLEE